jgi:hypothetical protein
MQALFLAILIMVFGSPPLRASERAPMPQPTISPSRRRTIGTRNAIHGASI